jgi:hypothetical protein
MSKHRSNDKRATSDIKQRISIILQGKLHVIKRHGCDKCTVSMANAMGIPESTLRSTRKQAEKLNECCRSSTRITANRNID